LILIIASGFLYPASACADRPPALAVEQFEAALRLWEQRKYKEARTALEEAIRIDPEYTNAYRWLHDLRTGPLREPRDSLIQEIERHLDSHPTSAMWHYLATRYEDDLQRRADLAARAIDLEPAYPWGYYAVGHVKSAEGKPDEAELEFRRALEADSLHHESRMSLARMYAFEEQRFGDARVELEKIVEASPDFDWGGAQFHLERLLYRTVPIDSVAAYYGSITVSDDTRGQWFAYLGLGNALRNLRRYEEAAEAYGRALKINPRGRWWSRAHYYRGETLYRLGDVAGALASYDSVLASDDSTAYYFSRSALFRANLSDSSRTGAATILDVPYQSQFGLPTCAGTCISMVMNYYGDPVDADEVNAFVHNPLYGYTGHQENIVRYPLYRGYVADWAHAPLVGYLVDAARGHNQDRLNHLRKMIDAGVPVEIAVHGGTHAIVAVGYDDRKGAIIVHNSQWRPARNIFEEIPNEEFIRHWASSAYSRFLILPPDKRRDVPSWSVSPLLSQYPNDYTGLLLGTGIPRSGDEPSMCSNSPDRYAAQRDEAVSLGLSLDRFGAYQRLWFLTHYRYNDDRWRYEVGFSNRSFPSPAFPAFLTAFWEPDVCGGSIMFRPFQSLHFGVAGERIEGDDLEIFGLPWERGSDVHLTARYHYGQLEGWLYTAGWIGTVEISGSAKSLGSDYSYARGDLGFVKAFGLPLSSSILLRLRTVWTEGTTPLQGRFLPGVNVGFRSAGNDVEPGDHGVVFSGEVRKQVLGSTPMHPSIPLIVRAFYDASYAWPQDRDLGSIRISQFWKSWGLGVEYAFLSLDVAFPADSRIRHAKVYFNVIGISQLMLGSP
jgi:tetratricopeptide (TPR) repeat protein